MVTVVPLKVGDIVVGIPDPDAAGGFLSLDEKRELVVVENQPLAHSAMMPPIMLKTESVQVRRLKASTTPLDPVARGAAGPRHFDPPRSEDPEVMWGQLSYTSFERRVRTQAGGAPSTDGKFTYLATAGTTGPRLYRATLMRSDRVVNSR